MKKVSISSKFTIFVMLSFIILALVLTVAYFTSFLILFATVAAGFVILLIYGVLAANSSAKYIGRLSEAVFEAGKGNFNHNLETGIEGEIGQLENALAEWINKINLLTDDLSALLKRNEEGDKHIGVNERPYDGRYRELIRNANSVFNNLANEWVDMTEYLKLISQGDIKKPLRSLPGIKLSVNDAANALCENITMISEEAKKISASISAGLISKRGETGLFKGEWARIAQNMYDICETMTKPVTEIKYIASRFSKCEYTQSITGNYSGDFLDIKTDLNKAASSIVTYIGEISTALNSMTGNKAYQPVNNEFIGAFANLKGSLNKAGDNFNSLNNNKNKIPLKQIPAQSINTTHKLAAAKPKNEVKNINNDNDHSALIKAHPHIKKNTMLVPSAAHIYDNKDFGKY